MNPAVWTFLVIVVGVCVVALLVLRYLTGVVADRRTRKIISEGMGDIAPKEDEKTSSEKKDP